MSAPVKGELEVLDKKGKATSTIPVQFNPGSLTLKMSNSTDGAQSRGRQRQQYNGKASTTLNLDLEFDTADEGTESDPVDVRTRTADIAQFVLPGGKESKQAPPRVRFRWGTFEFAGVMDSLTEELSFFSGDGVPLRAKLSVQIKEQDARFEALETGPGANRSSGAAAAGEGADTGGGPLDKVADALAGETPADFLARNGLAPEAWKALGGALDALSEGVEFEAGVSVGFSADLSLGGGIGISAGFEAGLGVSLEASLGLDVSAGVGAATAGAKLAAAGGPTAAIETAKAQSAASAASAARSAFAAPAPSPTAPVSPAKSPLSSSGATRSLPTTPAAPAPAPPRADPRASTYGFGVPLRDRISVPGADPGGWVVLGAPPPVSGGSRSAAPWERLAPLADQTAADAAQHARRPSCGCHRCDPHRRRSR